MNELEKKQIIEQALEAIEQHKITRFAHLVAYLPIGKTWFFANGLNQVDSIKSALEANRARIKQSLVAKWYKSDNPALQIALYKLLADPDELEALRGGPQKVDITSSGERIMGFNYVAPDEDDNPSEIGLFDQ